MQCEVEGLMEGLALPNNVDAVLDQIEAQQAVELKSKSTPLEFCRLSIPTRAFRYKRD
jgi:hypothetical protein